MSNITAHRITNTFIFTRLSPIQPPIEIQLLVLLRFKIKRGAVDAVPAQAEIKHHTQTRRTTLSLWVLDHQERRDLNGHHRRSRAPETQFKGCAMHRKKLEVLPQSFSSQTWNQSFLWSCHFHLHPSHYPQSWATQIQSQTFSCLRRGQCHNRHNCTLLNDDCRLSRCEFCCWCCHDDCGVHHIPTFLLVVIVFTSPRSLCPSTSSNLDHVMQCGPKTS